MNRVNTRLFILPLSGKDRAGAVELDQPPGAFPDQEVPVGLEQLLGMAAADAGFAQMLQERRADALMASGVSLTPAEEAVLEATPDAALDQMVTGLQGRLSDEARRRFLGQAGAALLLMGGVAVGAGLAASGCAKDRSGGPGGQSQANPSAGSARPTGEPPPEPGNNPATEPAPMPMESRVASTVLAFTGSRPDTGYRPTTSRKYRVRLGKGKVRGKLELAVVRRVLRRHLGGINYCYLSLSGASGKEPPPGAITVKFQVTSAGKTRKVTVTRSGLGKRLGPCVVKKLSSVRFPAPGDAKPVDVTWRYYFK